MKREIVNKFFKNGKFAFNTLRSKSNQELLAKITELTTFLPNDVSMSQRVWHCYNGIYTHHKCIGGNLSSQFRSFNEGYSSNCNDRKCLCYANIRDQSSKRLIVAHKSGKMKQVFQEKYGVDSPVMIPDIKAKIKQAFEARSAEQIQESVQKRSDTIFDRFGVKFAMQSPVLKLKHQENMMAKHGVKNSSQTANSRENAKQTWLENYGYDNPMKSPVIRQKATESLLRLYGVDNIMKSVIHREKAQATHFLRYGVDNPAQIHLKDIMDKLKSEELWLSFKLIYQAINYFSDYCSIGTVLRYAKKYNPTLVPVSVVKNISLPHRIISEYLTSIGVEHINNTRKLISPYEIDIYLPGYNIGIEVNGIYFHSEIAGGKSPNYHLMKCELCEAKGIHLLQFWDADIIKNTRVVIGIIMENLGIHIKQIDAKDCVIRNVNNDIANQFLIENHIKGKCNTKLYNGLYDSDELVACVAITGDSVIRYSDKLGYEIIGGMQSLIARMSYSFDRMLFNKAIVTKFGFKVLETTLPNCFYTNDYETLLGKVESDYNDLVWDCGLFIIV